MLTIGQIQTRFDVIINPMIDNVDEDTDAKISSTPIVPIPIDTQSTTISEFSDRLRPTTVVFNRNWTLIVSHPRFQTEYKTFIRNNL